MTWYDAENKRHGEPPLPEQKYYDIQGVDRLVSLPDPAPHRVVDKIVQAAISDTVKVAILCPPCIYGKGLGVVNTRSIQIPDLVKGSLEKGFAPIVGAGKTEWDNVHIEDLADVFVKLADATQEPSLANNPEIFGPKAYFFAEHGAHKWADVATQIAESASRQGYLPEPLTKSVSQDEVALMDGAASVSWGNNSKGVAERVRKYLGWQPKGPSIGSTIDELVAQEAKALGLTPKEKKGN